MGIHVCNLHRRIPKETCSPLMREWPWWKAMSLWVADLMWFVVMKHHNLWTCFRWWFKHFFIFTPTWGNDPIWLIDFQMGWNHQLVTSFEMNWSFTCIWVDDWSGISHLLINSISVTFEHFLGEIATRLVHAKADWPTEVRARRFTGRVTYMTNIKSQKPCWKDIQLPDRLQKKTSI